MKYVIFAFFCATSQVMALNIQLDFLHDDQADRFFESNPKARSAVEKAAQDLGNMLTNSLGQISKDIYSGTNGSTTARFDWSWSYINPVTGATETITHPSIDADSVIIYVGTRSMSDKSLGRGGAGGAMVQLSGSGIATEWIGAIDAAEAASNAAMRRGSGPLINTISGTANYSGYIGQYDLDYGLSVGNLWFDADTNNDGNRDSDAALSDFWHYDAYTSVAAGKTDLYSVALHELLHTLGAGTSETWNNHTDEGIWDGLETTTLSSRSDLIDDDGYHPYDSILSTRISDGVEQHPALSLAIAAGERKEITELDLAFLRDLGFETALPLPLPEPASGLLLSFGGILLLWRRSGK